MKKCCEYLHQDVRLKGRHYVQDRSMESKSDDSPKTMHNALEWGTKMIVFSEPN